MDNEGKLYLKRLSVDDGEDIYAMLQGILPNENEFKNDAYGLSYDEFKDWLRLQDDWSNNRNLPEGYVPQTVFWLYCDDTPVGFGKIRHRLTEASRHIGGNIGYAITNAHRGKGFGRVLMRELASTAKEMGIDERMATVEKSNPTSKSAIEHSGGVLIKETDERWYFSL